jgi:hypothetical protein
MKRHTIRKRARPPREFANFGEVIESDTPLVPTPAGREEGTTEGDEPSDFEAEVESHRAGGRRSPRLPVARRVAPLARRSMGWMQPKRRSGTRPRTSRAAAARSSSQISR